MLTIPPHSGLAMLGPICPRLGLICSRLGQKVQNAKIMEYKIIPYSFVKIGCHGIADKIKHVLRVSESVNY